MQDVAPIKALSDRTATFFERHEDMYSRTCLLVGNVEPLV